MKRLENILIVLAFAAVLLANGGNPTSTQAEKQNSARVASR